MFKNIIAKKSNYKFICLIALNLLLISISNAATFTVNTTNDTLDAANNGICADAAGNCSLRAAIHENNRLSSVSTTNRIHTIILPAGIYTLTLTGTSETNNARGDLNVLFNSNLTITGDSARTTIIQAGTIKSTNGTDGNGIDRVIRCFQNDSLTLNNLTIRNGKSSANSISQNGGGIEFTPAFVGEGTLFINNSVIADNFASGGGGGFFTQVASVIITNSLIAGNNSLNAGGGIITGGTGTPTQLDAINVTISGNTARRRGGGVNHTGTATFTNSTITENVVTDNVSGGGGGGFSVSGSTVATRFRNSIVINNTAPVGANFSATNPPMPVISGGTNLIGNSLLSTGWNATDLLNNTSANLGALANNGGQTDTHAVPTGSSALNAGQNCVVDSTCATFNAPANVTTDQRGENRLIDGFTQQFALFVDIGAFEKLAPSAANVSISGRVFSPFNRGLSNAFVTLTDASGQIHTIRTSSFGYFRFNEIGAGQTVIIGVRSKRYQFDSQVVSVNEQLEGLNFVPTVQGK